MEPLDVNNEPSQAHCVKTDGTRNIFKKDIRRLSNTDDKRNQIRWFPSTP